MADVVGVRRVVAMLAGMFAVVGVSIAVGGPGMAAHFSVRAQLPAAPPAAGNLRACMAQHGRLDVVFLMDESGSLGGDGRPGSDPDAQRVAGEKAALVGLVQLTESAPKDRPVQVRVALGGFGSAVDAAPDFKPGALGPFQDVNPSSESSLLGQADRFAALNYDPKTDYQVALAAARQVLADEAAGETQAGGQAPCQAVVFFTDGKLDPPPTDADARAKLCDPGGTMDQLVGDGVFVFTVALSSNLDPGDQDLLRRLTNGTGGGLPCGTKATPQTGLYLPVSDSAKLVLLFASLLGPVDGPNPIPGIFSVPAGVTRFVVEAITGGAGGTVRLTAPDRSALTLPASAPVRRPVGGGTATATWLSGQAVNIEAVFARDKLADGTWEIGVQPGPGGQTSTPLYTLQLFADIEPVLDSPDGLVSGEPATLRFHLADRQGQRLDGGPLVDDSTLNATVSPNGGSASTTLAVSRTGPGSYAANYTAPDGSRAAAFVVTASIQPPPSPDGVPITTPLRSFQLARKLPDRYPTVTPTSLSLPSVDGTDTSTGVVTLTASPKSGGCAWLTDFTLAGPPDAQGFNLASDPAATSPASCLHVPAGETRQLQVSVRPQKQASGRATGRLVVNVTSDVNPAPQQVELPVDLRLRLKANPAVEKWVLVVLVLIGILAPLAVLHLLNWLTARFPAPQLLRTAGPVVDVRSGGDITQAGTDARVEPTRCDFTVLKGTGRPQRERDMEVAGVPLTTVASGRWRDRRFSLFTGPYGVACTPSSPLVAGVFTRLCKSIRSPDRREVPLDLVGCWFFTPTEYLDEHPGPVKPDEPTGTITVRGKLTAIISEGTAVRSGHELLGEALLSLPEAVKGLPPPPRQPRPQSIQEDGPPELDRPDRGGHEPGDRPVGDDI